MGLAIEIYAYLRCLGKSSLVNSLLHNQDLALEVRKHLAKKCHKYLKLHQGASGSACTQVITEYRMPWPGQPTPFQAEVEFYEPAARDDMLRSYTADYYNYMHSPDELDDEASQELVARYSAASEIIQALFCNRAEFQRQGIFDDEAVQEHMKSAESPTDQAIIAKFSHWTRELLAQYTGEECIAFRNANTAAELSGMLEVFVKITAGDEESRMKPSLWPLVRSIRFDTSHDRLVSVRLTRAIQDRNAFEFAKVRFNYC